MPAAAFVRVTMAEVTTSTSYVDVDANSYGVPADAVGVWVRLDNTAGAAYDWDVRKNGSTDTFGYDEVYNNRHTLAYVGIDANGIFEARCSSTSNLDLYVMGYMTSPVTMNTNALDVSTGTTGSYVDVDLSSYTGATMALLSARTTATTGPYALYTRKNGSTDNRYADSIPYLGNARGVIVGLDGSQLFEQKIETLSSDLYVQGYYAGTKVTIHTNATDRSTTTTGSYEDVTALASGALVGFYDLNNTSAGSYDGALRKNGESEDPYAEVRADSRTSWIVECDGSRIIEQKIENSVVDLWELGYATAEFTEYTKALSLHIHASGTVPSRTVARVKALSQHLHAIGKAPRVTSRTLSLHVHAIGTIPSRIAARLKTLSGVVSIAGTMTTVRAKRLEGRVLASSFASRAIGKTLSKYAVVRSAIGRAIERRLSASVSVAGTILRGAVKLKSLLGGVVTSGAVARATSRTLSIVAEVRGTISRFPQKVISKGAGVSGSIGRSIARSLSTSVGVTATVARQFVISKTLAARAVISGVSSRVTSRILSARSAASGAVSRIPSKILQARILGSGILGRAIGRTIDGRVSAAGAIAKGLALFRTIEGRVVASASIVTTARKIIIVAAGVAGGIVRREVSKTVRGVVSVRSSLSTLLYDVAYALNRAIRRIFGRVQITYTDPFFSAGVGSSANQTGRLTYPAQTTDNVSTEAFPWFSLHRNVLDGSYHPMPSDESSSVGWWGTQLSAAVTGAFVPPYPTLTITHAARSVLLLQVVGDDKLGEYPVDFEIKLYGAGDVLLHTETVTGNALGTWEEELDEAIGGVVKQVLTITTWSRPEAVSKIAQFFTMVEETYEGDDLFSIRVLEQREGASGTIPQGNSASSEITVRLNNVDGTFSPGNVGSRLNGMILNNRAIKAWLGIDLIPSGVRRWYPLGTFYSRDWNAPDREVWAEVTGLDMLDRLRTTTFSTSEVYEGKTLSELAVIVLSDAGLTDADWEIDSALEAVVVPYAWFETMSHRDALRKIAAAALGQCYCNRDGKVVVEVYEESTLSSFTYDGDNIFDLDHPLKWSEMVNRVEVQATPRVPLAEEDLVVDVEEISVPAYSSVTRTFFFTQSPCIDVQEPTIVGGAHVTVDAWTAYAFGVSVTFANSGASSEAVTSVTIRGKVLDVGASRVVSEEDAESIARNGVQALGTVLTSDFWQDENRAADVASLLIGTYKDPRRNIAIKARGNIAQLLGDTITAPSTLVGTVTERQYAVMSQDIKWDGALEVLVEAIAEGGPVVYHKELIARATASGFVSNNATKIKALVAKVSARGTVRRLVTIIERIFTSEGGDGQAERYYASSYLGDLGTYVTDYATADDVTTNLEYLDLYRYYRYYSNLHRETVRRGYVFFPTATIPAGATLSYGKLRLFVSARSDYPSLNRYCSPLYVSDGQPNYPTESGGSPALAVGDYANSKFTTRTSIARDDVVVGAYNEVDVLSWIKKAARTKFRLTQTASAGSDYTALYYRVHSSEGASPPQLVVSFTYEEGGS